MIIRTQKTKNYSIMANECLRNPKISSRAKGIYAYIMTLPDNWELHKKELYQNFPEGRDFLDKGFNELRDLGYIKQERVKDEMGKFIGCEYMVYEHANQTIENKGDTKDSDQVDNTITGKSVDGQKQQPENPYTVKPCMANPQLLKTNIEQKTKKKKEPKTNKKEVAEKDVLKPTHHKQLVSDSFSFFDEENKSRATSLPFGFVEASEEDKKESIKEDLLELGLTLSQIKSVLRIHPTDVIDQAIIETHHAQVEQKINDKASQYFYGVLRNISSEKKLA